MMTIYRQYSRHSASENASAFLATMSSVSKPLLGALEQCPWLGNIRELENLVERAVLTAKDGILNISSHAALIESPVSPDERRSEIMIGIPVRADDFDRAARARCHGRRNATKHKTHEAIVPAC